MTKDPVCGMTVNETKATYQSQHQGKTYSFCSAGCKQRFDKNPAQFVKKA